MIDSVMFWNEPNNKSHWDFEVDPDWHLFARMINGAAEAVKAVNPNLTRVLGGMSPIETAFVENLKGKGVLDHMDAIAVHGFPLDWNHWKLNDWPDKIREIQQVTDLPVWVSEVGISTYGADEVQVFGLRRTAELLSGLAPRIHWYSLYDLPQAGPATTHHHKAAGSSCYRHFHMGLLREDGTPKPALDIFSEFTPELGICQWFQFEDHRLDDAVEWLHKIGVKKLRTGLSWAESYKPGAEQWFERQMQALKDFDVTVTFSSTPEHRGILPNHSSAPLCLEEFAEFCGEMVRRYAPPASAEPEAPEKIFVHQLSIPADFPWNTGDTAPDLDVLRAMRYIVHPDLAEERLNVAIISAHPDDETIGAGSRLPLLGSTASLIFTTDGAPFDLSYARAAGFEKREDYSAGRRKELHTALTASGALPGEIRFLKYPDQQASLNLIDLTRDIVTILDELRPDMVLTHPYEGGHPDHDATAYAVHSACRILCHERNYAPVIVEMTSYHSQSGDLCAAMFLPAKNAPVSRVYLTPDQLRLKQIMMASYVSQQSGLMRFPLEIEAFRPAPKYDFTVAPHEGPLFYDSEGWGMTGDRWRKLAHTANEKLFDQTVLL